MASATRGGAAAVRATTTRAVAAPKDAAVAAADRVGLRWYDWLLLATMVAACVPAVVGILSHWPLSL